MNTTDNSLNILRPAFVRHVCSNTMHLVSTGLMRDGRIVWQRRCRAPLIGYPARCPDGVIRIARTSRASFRHLGEEMAREPGAERYFTLARVQANGLTVYGVTSWDGDSRLPSFHATSPAFLPRRARRYAACLLFDVAARVIVDRTKPLVARVAAYDAVMARAYRLAGMRGSHREQRS